MEKIKIKLKECCLTCEHFDPSGIKGLSIYYTLACGCGEIERVIACGHMEVCAKYNNAEEKEADFGWIKHEVPPDFGMPPGFVYECKKCHESSRIRSAFCPHCGQKNIRNET